MPVMTWECPVEGCGKVVRVEKRTRQGLAMTLSACRRNHEMAHERRKTLGPKVEILRTQCSHCGAEIETWGYENLRSARTGKPIRYTDHRCPKLVNL